MDSTWIQKFKGPWQRGFFIVCDEQDHLAMISSMNR